MSVLKITDIREMSNEKIIAEIVNNAVRIAHQGGIVSKAQAQTELRLVTELSVRLNLDKELLMSELNV